MATVNFSVPDEIKQEFNKTFPKANKSQIIARLMRRAIEEKNQQERRVRAIDRLLGLRKKMKPVRERDVRKARLEGRP